MEDNLKSDAQELLETQFFRFGSRTMINNTKVNFIERRANEIVIVFSVGVPHTIEFGSEEEAMLAFEDVFPSE